MNTLRLGVHLLGTDNVGPEPISRIHQYLYLNVFNRESTTLESISFHHREMSYLLKNTLQIT